MIEESSGVALVAVNLETNEVKHCSKVRVCLIASSPSQPDGSDEATPSRTP